MTKSKRRGPKKMGRTRKARSRRYGGADQAAVQSTNQTVGQPTNQTEVQPTNQTVGQPTNQTVGQSAFAAALNHPQATGNVVAVNGIEFELGDTTVLATEYGKFGGTPYTMFGGLATAINASPAPKHNKIVALLYLIKYHIEGVDDGTKDAIQTEFQKTVMNINNMKQDKSADINTSVLAIVEGLGAEFKFGPITDQSKADLIKYINDILELLKPTDAPPG